MSELSPRDIINALDVAVIDASIEELNEELAALKALRAVALKKSGAKRATSRGNASSGGEGKPARMTPEERCNLAFAHLQERGSMRLETLCDEIGLDGRGSRWMRKALSEDSRFTIQDDVVSLASSEA